ncbi:hypothetical protein ABZ746_25390 [Streptomyces sp. NPDC020096]|jgi:hypothetical protein
MSSEPWTIDSIAHALPHPVTRQQFLAEINLAPVDDLPNILQRWIRVAEDWTAAGPRLEALREHYQEHGTLPPDYETALVDLTHDIQEQARSRGAA